MNSLQTFLRYGTLAVYLSTASVHMGASAPTGEGRREKEDLSLASVADEAGLPRVLLIGDSISMGYTVPTRELLKGVANVHRIPTNGSSSDVGLKKLDEWLATDGAGKKWDVIHFNWGLHDLKHWKDGKLDLAGPQVNPVDQYEKNLREIVTLLKKTGAKLIFSTTTPVPEGSGGRVAKDEIAYNEAAARVMKDEGVAIDDLHALAESRLAEIQLPKNVHFSNHLATKPSPSRWPARLRRLSESNDPRAWLPNLLLERHTGSIKHRGRPELHQPAPALLRMLNNGSLLGRERGHLSIFARFQRFRLFGVGGGKFRTAEALPPTMT